MNKDENMNIRIPYKIARALEIVRCRDANRLGICDIRIDAGEETIRFYATDGFRLLRVTIPNETTSAGTFHIDGLALQRLAKAAAGSLPHPLRDLPLQDGDGHFPDAEQVIPGPSDRAAAAAMAFNPSLLADLGKCYAELDREASAKDDSAFGIRRSVTVGGPQSAIMWQAGGALDPIRASWRFSLTGFEAADGRGPQREACSAVYVLMPKRLD